MTYKNSIFIIFFSVLLASCKKEPALEVDEKFRGSWRHIIDEKYMVYLSIDDGSTGHIERYEYGKFKSDTQRRKWLIKKNKLSFGWLTSKSESFIVDVYPRVSDGLIISYMDTIKEGETYMVLDGEYYRRN